jgi:hypothetical protein
VAMRSILGRCRNPRLTQKGARAAHRRFCAIHALEVLHQCRAREAANVSPG